MTIKLITESSWFKTLIALIVGLAVGAAFYPEKHITKEEKAQLKQIRQYEQRVKAELEAEFQAKLKVVETHNKILTESLTQQLEQKTEEIIKLRTRSSEQIVKIIHPDGKIEEKIIRKSDTQQETQIITTIKAEFNRKITEIELRYKEVYAERLQKIKQEFEETLKQKDEKIALYEKKKESKINRYDTRLGLGIMTDASKYLLVERDIFGPIFVHGLVEADSRAVELRGGLGLGIKF